MISPPTKRFRPLVWMSVVVHSLLIAAITLSLILAPVNYGNVVQ